MNYSARQQNLRRFLEQKKLDDVVVTHMPNIRYLCGFTGSYGVLLMSHSQPLFFTDGRYIEQARTELRGTRLVVSKTPALAATASWLSAKRLTRRPLAVGFESEHLSVSYLSILREVLPSKTRLRATSGFVEKARMIKEPEEIERIRAAILLGSSLFSQALKWLRPGVAESVVAAQIEYAARRRGAERMSFETIVAAGTRSARPHGVASSQPIPLSGFVVLDFGVILSGYCSDMTRTVHLGPPTRRARSMYDAVREAQLASIAIVRPGVQAGQVDNAARSRLRRAGLGRYFSHSTGHGVGLEIHEPPRLAKGQRDILRPGMVITIEPGIYIPGKGGVRIEDIVLVTERGAEVLTPTTKELITL